MAHDRAVNAFMDPSKYITTANAVTGGIEGIKQMKPHGEAYIKRQGTGFVMDMVMTNLPRQFRMGHWDVYYTYELAGLHEDNQESANYLQAEPKADGNITVKYQGVVCAAIASLLGINASKTVSDMYKALTVMEAAYSGDLATLGAAIATAGGFPTLNASALNTLGRHATTYFSSTITNLS